MIDGRLSDGMYHINWGWNGYCNGYYFLNDLTPDNSNYSYGHWMVINAKPEHTGEFSLLALSNYDGGTGLSYNRTKIKANDYFFACASRLENRDNEPHSGSIALALTNSIGSIKQILSEGTFSLKKNYGYTTYKFPSVFSNVSSSEGDRLSLFYKTGNDSDWKPVLNYAGTHSSVSASDFTPEFSVLTWDIDPAISIGNTESQYTDRALKYAPYSFTLKYVYPVTPEVSINGEIITPINQFWYSIPFANAYNYEIKVIDKNNTSIGEINVDNNMTFQIYTINGVLIQNNLTKAEASAKLKNLPKGFYLLRSNVDTVKVIN